MRSKFAPLVVGLVCLVALIVYSAIASPFNLGIFLLIAAIVLVIGYAAITLGRRSGARGPGAH